jgi:hypothetical protein
MISLWQRIKNEIVQDVPAEIALCEFDCNKVQCTHEQWLACPRRRAHAARNLTPAPKETSLAGRDCQSSSPRCAT